MDSPPAKGGSDIDSVIGNEHCAQTTRSGYCLSFTSTLRRGKSDAYRQEIGRVVYEAPLGLGVPTNDRFQVIAEHDAANFIFDPNYFGIHLSDDFVMIRITRSEGRTVEQKKALYKAIADGLADKLSLRREDVFISLVEVRRENWSFGNGVAQYVM
jgi:phenylpyruvate tautomerase PptA (4-oxalocrotonate tautomerase family)